MENDKKIENILIKKGYKTNIIVNNNDRDLSNVSSEFLKKIETECKQYNKVLESNIKNHENYKDDNFSFTPEKNNRKSPMTVIDAPWGAGKTYFLESFFRHLIDKKISPSFFEKAILLDAWTLTSSKSISNDIVAKIILEISKNNKELRTLLVNIINWLFGNEVDFWKNKFGKEVKISKLSNLSILQDINNAEKIIPKTMVFIDHIERLGPQAWDVLRAISKLSHIGGFVFILPMDMKKLYLGFDDNKDDSEMAIEKFLDIKYFSFKQEYYSLLINMGFNEKDSLEMNKMLQVEIRGQKLSIRELEQRILSNRIKEGRNSSERIRLFVLHVWGATKEFHQYNIDLINNLSIKLKNIENIVGGAKHFMNQKKYINDFFQSYKTEKYVLLCDYSTEKYLAHNENEHSVWSDFVEESQKIELNIKSSIKLRLEKSKEQLVDIRKKQIILDINTKENKQTEEKLAKESEKSIGEKNNKQIVSWEKEISLNIRDIETIKNEITTLEFSNTGYTNKTTKLKDMLIEWNPKIELTSIINNFKEELKKITLDEIDLIKILEDKNNIIHSSEFTNENIDETAEQLISFIDERASVIK